MKPSFRALPSLATGSLTLLSACVEPEAVPAPPPAVTVPLEVVSAEPWPELDRLFQRTEGWIGADGAHSVVLGGGRTLWLFSDTWVGSIRDGHRTDAGIVNNTVALQRGPLESADLAFSIRRNETDGTPIAFLAPPDGRGWFWLQAGAVAGGRLHVFLPQIERTDDPGVFGFRSCGLWLASTADFRGDDPLAWRFELAPFPHAEFTPERERSFGCAALVHDGFLYAYGTEDVIDTFRARHLILARVPVERVSEPDAWRFFADGEWQADFRRASRLFDGMGSEAAVLHQPARGRFVIVYTENGLSERILARSAPQAWGPWSEPVELARCPESRRDPLLLTYAAKAHATLSSDDELAVSYVVNSLDFWQVARDASLYWPRFLRVRLRSP
ncbi:MAG: DUF4185 domain-containing protein [Planctomycetota bacterium]|nr:DUF4185 domain-containing protein [Planctomycetota bacterium]